MWNRNEKTLSWSTHGVFQTLVGDSRIAETLIDSDGINAVTFTGSVPVGAKLLKERHPN